MSSSPATTKFKLVMLDFDGTLFDSVKAIEAAFRHTFYAFLPDFVIHTDSLMKLISLGGPPEITIRALHPDPDSITNLPQWGSMFRTMYAIHGNPLIKEYPNAVEVVRGIQAKGIPVAIFSNKDTPALKNALAYSELGRLIPQKLIISDGDLKGNRKPHPYGFTDLLVPRLKDMYGYDWMEKEGEILMVGDTVADLKLAKNIGCRVCWCKYGEGDHEICRQLKPDYEIDSLIELLAVIENGTVGQGKL